MQSVVSLGLGKRAHSEKVQVAGQIGSQTITGYSDETGDKSNIEFAIEWCGYFPANNPKYSIIVTINKIGVPASAGGMAAPMFKEIVDYIVTE